MSFHAALSRIRQLLSSYSPVNYNLRRGMKLDSENVINRLMVNFTDRTLRPLAKEGQPDKHWNLLENIARSHWYKALISENWEHRLPSNIRHYSLCTTESPEQVCDRLWRLGYPDAAVQIRRQLEELGLWPTTS